MQPEQKRISVARSCNSVLLLLVLLASLSALLCVLLIKYFQNSAKYQAVFLKTGEVYFGKIEANDTNNFALRDVYYLRYQTIQQPDVMAAQTGIQTATVDLSKDLPDSSKNTIELVHMGSELHQPENMLHIPRESVLFWEDLRSNSNIYKSIMSSK